MKRRTEKKSKGRPGRKKEQGRGGRSRVERRWVGESL